MLFQVLQIIFSTRTNVVMSASSYYFGIFICNFVKGQGLEIKQKPNILILIALHLQSSSIPFPEGQHITSTHCHGAST